MTEETKLFQPKLALGELGIESVVSKLGQDKSKMLSMFVFGFGVDKDVIDVNDDKLVEVLVEDGVHQPHECSRSIGEAEGHDGVLI